MALGALAAARIRRWVLVAVIVLAIVYVLASWPRWQLRAEMATGFGARIACGCRYIEGRDLKSCESDFARLDGMSLVRFTDDPANRTVHASVPLLADRKATFKHGFGCLPDKIQ